MNTFAEQIEEAIINQQGKNRKEEIVIWNEKRDTTSSSQQFNLLYTEEERKKINSFREKNGFCTEEIMEKLYENDDIYGLVLKKDATKQNIPEPMQIKKFDSIICNNHSSTHHAKSENCIVTINEKTKIVKQTQVKKRKNKTASIDYQFILNQIVTYCFFKYTSGTGGSQNHVKAETRSYIEAINKLGAECCAQWYIILDGTYWTSEIFKELKSLIDHDNIIITNSDNLNNIHIDDNNAVIIF